MMRFFYLLLPLLLLPGCDDPSQSEQESSKSFPLQKGNSATPSTFDGQKAYGHCRNLCQLGPRPSGSVAYERQLQYLEEQLHSAGWKTQRQAFSAGGLNMVNLHAVFPQSEEATRSLLITCHIDTKNIPHFIGADDGASGAALILELARTLSFQPRKAAQIELVFFDGEESRSTHITDHDGLYGSRYDASQRVAKQSPLPRWQLNLDMVGGAKNIMVIPSQDTSQFMYEQYRQAVSALGLSPEHWTVYPGSYLDDHHPFLQIGVDALNLICYFQTGRWWHTTADDMSRISPRKLRENGQLVLKLISQLLP